MAPLLISTDVDENGIAILSPAGGLDRGTAADLAAAISAVLTGYWVTRLVVDLARVPVLDTVALRALLRGRAEALQAGATFRVMRAHGRVRQVLHLTGTCQLLDGTAP